MPTHPGVYVTSFHGVTLGVFVTFFSLDRAVAHNFLHKFKNEVDQYLSLRVLLATRGRRRGRVGEVREEGECFDASAAEMIK